MADPARVDILPQELVVGDSFDKIVSLSEFPAPTWVLTVVLINVTDKVTLTSVADGTDHKFDIDATVTAVYKSGEYDWQAQVTSAPERCTIARGYITLLPNIAALATLDARSTTKKILDALEATIEKRATTSQMAYTIASGTGTRSISRMTHDELIKARNFYQSLWNQELKDLQATEGKGQSSFTRAEFLRPI